MTQTLALSPEEVAAILGIARSTVLEMARDGRLVRVAGLRKVRIAA